MKICCIGAKNFRTLEDFELRLQPRYCAISGRNNAGKSAVISIIQYFLDGKDDDSFFMSGRRSISFQKDLTQWCKDEVIEISITLEVNRDDDSEVFFVVEKLSEKDIENENIIVKIVQKLNKEGNFENHCFVNNEEVEARASTEILKKFRSSANLVVHNSTNPARSFFFIGNGHTEIMETLFSAEDRRKILEAEKGLQARVKKAAKQHKDELDKLLGKLSDKYQVELSSADRGRSAKFPLEIKLTDKSVDVPLNDWGSGTQNRTRILISVLEAIRMRSSVTVGDRSTPVFLVEEPESFLHPSAQAEFGQVLNGLAEELKIQIIATTHSPYMLNQSDPSANYLLERNIERGLPKRTNIKDTSGDDWMVPFAENLGIVPSEFVSWKSVFGVHSTKVVLVEGEIDKKYFEHFKEKYQNIYTVPSDVEIVSYGGKDALRNNLMLQFMINKFGKVFITFDLDAQRDVEKSLTGIGLVVNKDFSSVGKSDPGQDCIEGLLPTSLRKIVYANQHNEVAALGSADSSVRKSAKSKLKNAFYDEFVKGQFEDIELQEFQKLFRIIAKAFS